MKGRDDGQGQNIKPREAVNVVTETLNNACHFISRFDPVDLPNLSFLSLTFF